MLKHLVHLESPKGTPSVVGLFTGWILQFRQYVCSALIEEQLYPSHGDSAQAALDGAVNFLRGTRYRMVRGPTLTAASRVRCYRWQGNYFLNHFLLSAPMTREQAQLLAAAPSEQAPGILSTWLGSPLYRNWPVDSTIRWQGIQQDAERILAAVDDDDLTPPNEDFWTQP